jgi:parvulin-like peptidyl-prolyl isomerase
MRRAAAVSVSIAISAVVGICCAQFVTRSVIVRDKLGIICGRGHLVAMVHGHGIYQAHVDRTVNELHYPAGTEHNEGTSVERQSALADLIANAALQARADREKIPRADVKREFNLLRSQFRDDKTWRQALRQSGFFTFSLWLALRKDLRAGQWVSKRVAPELDVTESECRGFYDSHPENFFVPALIRVSHLFLAAPPETAPEIVEAKQTAIEALSVRLAASEDFATLAAENSEDEATKLRGGDLGYFSATRMPPDFVEAALKLHPGEISRPIRTRLGFHILKLIDVQQARQKTFDEARSDIAIELANEKRATAIQQLIVRLGESVRWRIDLSSETDYLRSL